MRPKSRTVEQELARIAGRQHGVATRAQLLAAGVSSTGIRRRVDKGTLLVEYPGVYRVGHCAPSLEARYLAAVLACGEHALLSGRAAGHLYGLLKRAPRRPEVTAPTERWVRGVATRRCRNLDPNEATTWRGIPITTVARALVDLASTLTAEELARACHEAGVRYRTTPSQMEAVLARRPNTPGAANLRRVLRGDQPVTLSALERRSPRLLREQGLPLPRTNKRAGSYRVDCRWPDHTLPVELDSSRYHSPRHAWEQDRRREREARAREDELLRYTCADVFENPGPMLEELRPLLRASGGS